MRAFTTAKTITALYLLTALAMSFTHIADLFGIMGSDWQRWIAPVMIDAVAVIGKLSMSTAFTPKTRARGKAALWIAGSISFTANVTVGYVEHMYGNAILGAIVVTGALWAESHLSHLRPTTKRTRPAVKRTRATAAKPTARKVSEARKVAAFN